jgi:hypothetical protein
MVLTWKGRYTLLGKTCYGFIAHHAMFVNLNVA